jgi:replication factor C large subunit
MELWVDKHKPKTVSGISGQGKAKRGILDFMDSWRQGQGGFLHGPPGVGKTLMVEALASERGLSILRLNASDSRNASQIEERLLSASQSADIFGSGRLILIDEVDGISGRERGAVGSIVKIIKGSRFPVFLIANDPWKSKLAPLRKVCKVIGFSKIMSPSIEKRMKDILGSEGIGYDESALKSLARFSQGDMRSAISDLQMVSHGRKILKEGDLSILGYREREGSIFTTLPVIFHSRNISAARKSIFGMDKDPDEIFWWIESNVHQELVPGKLSDAYDLLSRADIMRQRVRVQQNWRFKAFMTDLMSGISLVKGDTHRPPGYRPYQQPTRIIMMGRSRTRRAIINELSEKIGGFTHSSKRTVKKDYLPFLRIILRGKSQESAQGLELEKEEANLIIERMASST